MSEQWESGHFFSSPQDGAIVVIGVASRQAGRWGNEVSDSEVALAKDHAARKIALFYGISGTVESFHQQGASFFDFIAESRIHLESPVSDHTQFIERLIFDPDTDIFVFGRGTLVRFRYAANVSRVNFTGTADKNGRPSWLNNFDFDIDGYAAAVGFSQNQVWLRDTVTRAAESAAARLIKKMETKITTSVADVLGQGSLTHITSTSSGVLNDFRIIEFWIDPVSMSVYTLGIARLAE